MEHDNDSPSRYTYTNNEATLSAHSNSDGWNNIHVFYGNTSHVAQASHINKAILPLARQQQSDGNNNNNSSSNNNNNNFRRWFSQSQQDEFVSRLLRNKRNGYFVDLAANDAIRISNTYALETYFHWQGLCIEANPIYWAGLAYRSHCQIVAAVVGQEMMQAVKFKFPNRAPPKGGIVGAEFDNHEASQFGEDQWRYTVTLEHILDRFQAPTVIDYLSLDVEGAETFVLEKFPFERYRFHVMTIERPDETLCRLLVQHGYRLLKQLKKRWGETVWIHETLLSPDKSSLIDLSVLDMDTEHYEYSEKMVG